MPIPSKKYRLCICYCFILSVAKLILSQAELKTQITNTATRLYYDEYDSAIYYDLFNENQDVIKIYPDNIELSIDTPSIFLRKKSMLSQVMPDFSYKSPEEIKGVLYELKNYINVSNDDLFLIIIYIITAFNTNVSHPILILLGGAGTSKTTSSRVISKIIDPNKNAVLQFPSLKDLEIILSNRYFACFDNIGDKNISKDISNLLCCAVTGASTLRRALYSDSDEKSLFLKNCLVLNGINLNIFKVDLITRSIVIKMNTISEANRKTESQIWAEFEEYLPRLLGAIFFTLQTALSDDSEVTKLSRMADFEEFAAKVAEAIEEGGADRFQTLYHNQLSFNHNEALMINPIVSFVSDYLERFGAIEGTPEEVYHQIKSKTNCEYYPKAPNTLVRKSNENKDYLEEIGIHFVSERNAKRYLKIYSDNSAQADIPVYLNDIEDDDIFEEKI